jgi:hypothetical protein
MSREGSDESLEKVAYEPPRMGRPPARQRQPAPKNPGGAGFGDSYGDFFIRAGKESSDENMCNAYVPIVLASQNKAK